MSESKLKSYRICSVHFRNAEFTNSLRNRLLRQHLSAVPVPWFHGDPLQEVEPVIVISSTQISLSQDISIAKINHIYVFQMKYVFILSSFMVDRD